MACAARHFEWREKKSQMASLLTMVLLFAPTTTEPITPPPVPQSGLPNQQCPPLWMEHAVTCDFEIGLRVDVGGIVARRPVGRTSGAGRRAAIPRAAIGDRGMIPAHAAAISGRSAALVARGGCADGAASATLGLGPELACVYHGHLGLRARRVRR